MLLLRQLKKEGWRAGVAHKGSRQRAHLELQLLKLKENFLTVATAENLSQAECTRPCEELYLETARRLRMGPSAAIIVASERNDDAVRVAMGTKMRLVQIGRSCRSRSVSELSFDELCSVGAVPSCPVTLDELDSLVLHGRCQAQFDDDLCWYPAIVDALHMPREVHAPSSFTAEVTFIGYGNRQVVTERTAKPLMGQLQYMRANS